MEKFRDLSREIVKTIRSRKRGKGRERYKDAELLDLYTNQDYEY